MIHRSVFLALFAFTLAPSAFAQESSPEQFQEMLEAWEGRWKGSGTDEDGNEMVAIADCRIAGDGTTLICNSYMGEESGIWFIVYDRAAKRIRSQWGQSDGEAAHAIIFKDGKDWVQKGTGSTPDGKKTEYTHRISISNNGNTHEWKRTRQVDGATQTSGDTWQRLSSRRAQ